jgi:hypothetical protein
MTNYYDSIKSNDAIPTWFKEIAMKFGSDVKSDQSESEAITPTTVTASGLITGSAGITNSLPAASDAEHGAGAVGTAFAPRTYRWQQDGHIITEIHVDLTGLAVVGTAAKDVIGLAAVDECYIGRYVTATNGIVYRIEMICVELPTEGTATITTDIDLGADDQVLDYDEGADDIILNTGGLVAGQIVVNETPALTANDYIYLIEGDTTAATGVYSGGQYIIRLFGHALLS